MVRFERMRSCDRSSGMEGLYDRMCALHRAFPRNELIGYRKEYIGIILMRQRNDSAVGHRIITAYSSVDSARYPDDFHMIKALLIPETENVVVRYRLVRECLNYFHRVQSHSEIARMYVEAGHVMFDLRDTIKGVEYSRKAAEIYERLGLYYPYMLSKQNMAVFKGREESGVS